MKAHDKVRKETISMVHAAVKQYEIDRHVELDDEGIIDILTRQVRERKDALSDFEKAGRTDLLESYTDEIKVREVYLSEPFAEEEIRQIVPDAKAELGVENRSGMRRLMGTVIPKVKGRADGGTVRNMVMGVL
jgi:hypothetical protein